jgi:hypothetical protein
MTFLNSKFKFEYVRIRPMEKCMEAKGECQGERWKNPASKWTQVGVGEKGGREGVLHQGSPTSSSSFSSSLLL